MYEIAVRYFFHSTLFKSVIAGQIRIRPFCPDPAKIDPDPQHWLPVPVQNPTIVYFKIRLCVFFYSGPLSRVPVPEISSKPQDDRLVLAALLLLVLHFLSCRPSQHFSTSSSWLTASTSNDSWLAAFSCIDSWLAASCCCDSWLAAFSCSDSWLVALVSSNSSRKTFRHHYNSQTGLNLVDFCVVVEIVRCGQISFTEVTTSSCTT